MLADLIVGYQRKQPVKKVQHGLAGEVQQALAADSMQRQETTWTSIPHNVQQPKHVLATP